MFNFGNSKATAPPEEKKLARRKPAMHLLKWFNRAGFSFRMLSKIAKVDEKNLYHMREGRRNITPEVILGLQETATYLRKVASLLDEKTNELIEKQ